MKTESNLKKALGCLQKQIDLIIKIIDVQSKRITEIEVRYKMIKHEN